MRIRVCSLIFGFVILSGCAAAPNTPEGFFEEGRALAEGCSSKSLIETSDLVLDRFNTCYAFKNTDTPTITQQKWVERKVLEPNKHRILVYTKVNWNQFLEQMVEIQSTPNCPALIKSYGPSRAWNKKVQLPIQWSQDQMLDKCLR